MARDAWYFLIPSALVAGLFFWSGWIVPAAFFLLLTLFIAYFFRDPERQIPPDPNAVVSPADGRIIRLEETENGTSLSIFLSVFDVHVNRAPVAGKLLEKDYRRGRFLVAYNDQASVENERMILRIGPARPVTFALVAGLVARRIRVWTREGEEVEKGDRIGLIRFGSRVDILIPTGCRVVVSKGDRVAGGSSILAYWE